MLLIRRIGAVILAAAAVLVWFLAAPAKSHSSAPDFSSDIASAASDYDSNNASTESAPQQQVVNGWAEKDLLNILVKEQQAALAPAIAPHDNRVPAELLLAVLGIALVAGTSPRSAPEAAATGASPSGDPARPAEAGPVPSWPLAAAPTPL